MGEAIRHRGPDDEGFYSDDRVAMIHKRLSIIDLKTGHQPIANETGEIQIIVNGEIYNYRELTQDLTARGHEFTTKSDSEVILHAYEEYGPECVKKFNGMFAFALWDRPRRRLFFARDRIGIKPFYYSNTPDRFLFGSEIKALTASPWIKTRLNEETLQDFLTFQNILDDKTFFAGIYKLPAGHYGIIDDSGLKIEQYWDLTFPAERIDSPDAAVEGYRIALDHAVERHMISDVPLGSYLSGGIDSTSVAWNAAQHFDGTMNTFTGAFAEGFPFDERPFSRQVAESIGANMYDVEITPEDFENLLDTVVYHLDEPSIGSGALPQFIVSRLVSQHVKVVLTGHGGDELFAGYQVFKAQYLRRKLKESLANVKLFKNVKPSEGAHLLYFMGYPLLFDRNVEYGLFVMYGEKARRKLLREDFQRRNAGYDPFDTLRKVLGDREFQNEDRLMYLYVKTYLPTLLLQEDKVGMAHSIEARLPILDNEVVDFAASVSSEAKLHNMELKYVPREAARGRLPEDLFKTSKKGFPTPIAKWFRTSLKSYVFDTLLSSDSRIHNYLDKKELESFINRFMNTKTVYLYDYASANRIYSLLTIEHWLRRFDG